MNKRAAIFMAEGFEEIEAVTIIDVLRRAGIQMDVVGIDALTVKGSRGVVVTCEKNISDIKNDLDGYILPGGMPGALNLSKSEALKENLVTAFKSNKIIAAICASPAIVLGPFGLLNGKSATCYPGMESEFPKEIRFKDEAVVCDGNIITSRGPATAMLFALTIIEKLIDQETADKVSRGLLCPQYIKFN